MKKFTFRKTIGSEQNSAIKKNKVDKKKKNVKIRRSNGVLRGVLKNNKNIIITCSETGLDQLIKQGVLRDLPILGIGVGLIETGRIIHRNAYISRLNAFIEHFNNNITDEKKKEKIRQRILEDGAKRDTEIQYILEMIERYISDEKAIILSSLYLAYLEKMINWSQFIKYSETVYHLLPFDYDLILNKLSLLHKTDEERWQLVTDLDFTKANDISSRWYGLGLLEPDTMRYNTFTVYGIDGAPHDVISPWSSDIRKNTYHKTPYGELLFRIIKKYSRMEYPDMDEQQANT